MSEPSQPDYASIAEMETELGLPHSEPARPVLLTRDAILKSGSLRTEEVPVPEWGGSVLVRELTGRQRDEFEASLAVQRGKQVVPDVANMRAKLVARCVIDPDSREPLFTQQDVAALGELSGAALNRVAEVASRLSGLKEEDLEEMAGNSGAAGPGGGSSSPSPATSGALSPSSWTGPARLS